MYKRAALARLGVKNAVDGLARNRCITIPLFPLADCLSTSCLRSSKIICTCLAEMPANKPWHDCRDALVLVCSHHLDEKGMRTCARHFTSQSCAGCDTQHIKAGCKQHPASDRLPLNCQQEQLTRGDCMLQADFNHGL